MNAYTQRPFTDDERSFVRYTVSYLQRFNKLLPVLAAWRLFFSISVCTALVLFLVLGIFGQTRLTVAIALFLGVTMGNAIHQAWTRAAQRSEENWEKQWGEQRAQWEQVLEGGVVETLTTTISEYIIVGSEDSEEEDCVCFIPVGESETLCLFTTELDTETAGGFPGKTLTVIRFPAMETIYQVTCKGTSPEPLVTLSWSDFSGFSSADSFYSWLVHGKVYPLPLDRLGEELISTE